MVDLLKNQILDQLETEEAKCKLVLEKLTDYLLREHKNDAPLETRCLLNKIIGFAAQGGLNELKEKVISGM